MATDATGTPTPLGIPKYNTSVDAPSGLGFNAAMDSIDTIIQGITGAINIVPAGAIMPYAASAPPAGWLVADGSAVSRTTYSALFTRLATTWGAGDGSTTFNLPDLRGRLPAGLGTHASVAALNLNDGQGVASRRPHHRTTKSGTVSKTGTASLVGAVGFSDPGHSHPTTAISQTPNGGAVANDGGGTPVYAASITGVTTGIVVNNGTLAVSDGIGVSDGIVVGSGVGTDALDTPSFVVVQYIIKT